MDRQDWWAAVHGVTRELVGHDLATKHLHNAHGYEKSRIHKGEE